MKIVSVSEFYDACAELYDKGYHREVDLAENEVIFESIKYKDEKVLDLGAGTGLFLEYCKAHPDRYMGIDISERMIEIAQKKFPLYNFMLLNAHDIYYFKNDYELVVSLFGSLSHEINIKIIFQRIYDKLKYKGRIYMMFYAEKRKERKSGIWETEEFIKKYDDIYAPYFIFKDEDIKNIMEEVGYENIRIYGMGFKSDLENNGASRKKMVENFKKEIRMMKSSSNAYWMIVEGAKCQKEK